MKDLEILKEVLDAIPENPVSTHSLSCKTGFTRRTIAKYLNLIQVVQAHDKILLKQVGLRILFGKEKNTNFD